MTTEFDQTTLADQVAISNASSIAISNEQHGLCIEVSNANAEATISLFGGHLLSFIPQHDKQERLWLSENAIFDAKTPIRGGIPICWPWFSAYSSNSFSKPLPHPDALPSHGVLRTQFWRLQSFTEKMDVTKPEIVNETELRLVPTNLKVFGDDALVKVYLDITIGEKLKVSLTTENNSPKSIEITQALHSYFKIENISNIHIEGVAEDYADKPTATLGNKTHLPYVFEAETDRIHDLKTRDPDTAQTIKIVQNEPEQHIVIENYNNDSVVIWNPWQEKSMAMADMTNAGYRTMVCIEAANTCPTEVAPNTSISLQQIIQ